MASTLRIARGEQKNVTITLRERDANGDPGDPISLEGAIVVFTAKHSYRDAEEPIIVKRSDDGDISLPDDLSPAEPTGQAIIALLAEDTELLADGYTDELVYNLWAEFPNDDEDETFDGPRLAISGRLVVSPRAIEVVEV